MLPPRAFHAYPFSNTPNEQPEPPTPPPAGSQRSSRAQPPRPTEKSPPPLEDLAEELRRVWARFGRVQTHHESSYGGRPPLSENLFEEFTRGAGNRDAGAQKSHQPTANPPPPPPPHYQILGVPFSASAAEIERAAKERRIASHPDRLKRQKGLSEAQLAEIDELAKRVGCAADVLMDPAKRREYDRQYPWSR